MAGRQHVERIVPSARRAECHVERDTLREMFPVRVASSELLCRHCCVGQSGPSAASVRRPRRLRRARRPCRPRNGRARRCRMAPVGGPNRNFMVDAKGLAEAWPEGGPRVIWSRPLGPGHSAILGRRRPLYTMYRWATAARGRAVGSAESVIALDAATGKTIGNTSTRPRSRISTTVRVRTRHRSSSATGCSPLAPTSSSSRSTRPPGK